ncbi:glycosyl hydrolase [Edaphobacter acidisoli]|uniref:Glycosyl hydrolase n=1 Tax=Edaphobacter acidisoli TaxID=2040573 RepID=A0A916RZM8_9BACT|nr:glycoside hydrolase family 3 C-terminal domain-containing protein [Edaphobacter acidisoli]GGA78256.1 glycosyl hydrolase [Edaphobacter acidisoli]
MTLQEKIDFLGKTLNVPRLGIHASGAELSPPGSNAQFEGLHGVTVGGPGNWGRKSPGGEGKWGGVSTIPTTQFPQSVGLGETWDPLLIEQAAAEEGREARYIFQSVDRGGLIIRAPNADLARDPRWGRSEESYGEDPFFDGTMAAAFVRGLQGSDTHYWQAASLVKHFMANSNEDGRSGSSSNFDARLLHEYYAVPFRMAVEQGGANALMASYNAVNGVPMTTNPLLKDLAMKRWGFNGLIDSDRGAVTFMVTKHKYYPDMEHAVAGAIHAGVNQILNGYEDPLKDALRDGLVTEADIDQNLAGVFRVLFRLGLLDPPAMVPYSTIKAGDGAAPWDAETSKELVLKVTHESIVLLKNAARKGESPLLPLDATNLRSIAVVGPRANEVDSDFYGGTPPFAITPLEGIKRRVGDKVAVRYTSNHDEAVAMAKAADVAIVIIGNQPTCGAPFNRCSDLSEGKEAIDRKQIALEPDQQKLVEDVYAANPRTIVVLVSSFPYTIDWAETHIPAIVHMAHSSEEEGTALADVLFGDYNPAGRLVVTWPRDIAELPPMMDYNIRDGRTYMYFKGKPLYAFGFGLSYTRFKYSKMKVSSVRLSKNGEVTVSVDVTNVGSRAGDEVVEMYVRHIGSKVERPAEELKGFERVALVAGETKAVRLHLPAKSLAYWDVKRNGWNVESDRVDIRLGASSDDIRAERQIAIVP